MRSEVLLFHVILVGTSLKVIVNPHSVLGRIRAVERGLRTAKSRKRAAACLNLRRTTPPFSSRHPPAVAVPHHASQGILGLMQKPHPQLS